MGHLSEGTLRRMVDDQDARTAVDAKHLDGCSECQVRFDAASADARSVGALLAVPEANVDVSLALSRVRSAPAAQPRLGFRMPVWRPASRPMMLAAAAVIVALVATAVGIARDGFLYSPTSVAPVPVTVADMQALSQLSDYGTITWTQQPQLQVATSAAEAQAVSGLKPPEVTNLPAGVPATVTYAAMSQAVATFTFSADKAAAAAAAKGKTLPKLPVGIDGVKVTVTVGPAVGEIFGNLNQPSGSDVSQPNVPRLVVGESAAPTATSSSSQVTVRQLLNYILAQPGISPDLAAAIKAIGDPSTTLPIPVPIQYATATRVTVQGVQGLALGDNTGLGSGVVWVKHGVVFAVAGSIKQSDAINIANNLK